MRGWSLRDARVYLILLALFVIGPAYGSLADEKPVGLDESEQSTESYQVGDIVLKPEPTILEPHVNLRPAGFKEYMYDNMNMEQLSCTQQLWCTQNN